MRKFVRLMSVALTVLLLAAVMTACGEDAGTTTTDSGPSSTAGTTTTQGSELEMTIMVAAPLTGDFAELGRHLSNGAQLAAAYVNEQGGVESGPLAGATVAITVVDDLGSTEGASTAASQFVSNPDIFALMGFVDSGMAAAAGAIAARAGLPVVGSYVGAEFLTTENDNIIPMPSDLGLGAGSAVAFSATLGVQKVGILAYDLALVDSCIPGIETAAADLGIEVVADERFAPGAADFSVLIENLRGAGAELVLVGAADGDAARAVTQMREAGYDVPVVDFIAAGWRETLSGAAGEAVLAGGGVYGMDPGLVFDAISPDSEWGAIFGRYEEQYGKQMTVAAQYGFDSVLTIVACANAGAGDRAELFSYITQATGEGILGPIAFTDEPRPVSRYQVFSKYTGFGPADREVVAIYSVSESGFVLEPLPGE